jgi:hypothetical protein
MMVSILLTVRVLVMWILVSMRIEPEKRKMTRNINTKI